MKPLIDSYGRIHEYLRISLTDKCNLRCHYCMPEEGVPLRDKSEFMTSEETIEFARIFTELGIKKIRLTGGEPLVKRDVDNVMLSIASLPVKLSLTTNGILVDKHIDVIRNADLEAVNVSLDSLNKERFFEMTRRDSFDIVIRNIEMLREHDIRTKINVVLIRNVNDCEIIDFVEWTRDRDMDVRFIEYMPFEGNNWSMERVVPHAEILNRVSDHFSEKITALESGSNSTSKNFRLEGFKGTFGSISTITNPFCDSCNRIRLTADGKIKNCLFSSVETDLLTPLRNGADVVPLIQDAIRNKKAIRAGIDSFESDPDLYGQNRSMITIGG